MQPDQIDHMGNRNRTGWTFQHSQFAAGGAMAKRAADYCAFWGSMPATISVSEMMRIVKVKWSRWVREQFPAKDGFAWQAGYGAFSVSHSQMEAVKEYIAGQEEHHGKVSFQDELLSFLRKQGIEFDERYIWK